VQGADFIQENGPEVLAAKRALLQAVTAAARPEAIIASSTSGFTMSALQEGCTHPERCVIGHPFNPPHLMPLVEVVGGKATSAAVVDRAVAFYASLGKRAIRLNREVPGHVANRLQAALWREAVHLVAEGVASVADVDAAVTAGPGARWALMGPNLILHLGGGAGGIHHFMDHLSGPFTTWWKDLGNPELTPELRERLIAGVLEEANGRSIAELAAQRDAGLLAVLRCPQRER
jgi:3-hydroxyacyl-CoA dehydrogenase